MKTPHPLEMRRIGGLSRQDVSSREILLDIGNPLIHSRLQLLPPSGGTNHITQLPTPMAPDTYAATGLPTTD